MGILFWVMRAEATGLTMQAVELVSRREGERLLDGFGMMLNQKALELTFSSSGMGSTGRCSSS